MADLVAIFACHTQRYCLWSILYVEFVEKIKQLSSPKPFSTEKNSLICDSIKL